MNTQPTRRRRGARAVAVWVAVAALVATLGPARPWPCRTSGSWNAKA